MVLNVQTNFEQTLVYKWFTHPSLAGSPANLVSMKVNY